ncbi:MAG: hypothetical protein M9898_02200 [Chitinophagaceae bacterium]|nr:hypothetical protein [Chitinophagaceae bacterium]
MNFIKGLIVGYLLKSNTASEPNTLTSLDHGGIGLLVLGFISLIIGGTLFQAIAVFLFALAVLLIWKS